MKTIISASIKRLTKSVLAFAWIAALPALSQAADTTWTGDMDNSWNKAGNWSSATKPGFSQTVTISSSGANVTMSGDGSAGSLFVSGSGAIAPVLTISHNLSLNAGSVNVGSSKTGSGYGGTIYHISGRAGPQYADSLNLNIAATANESGGGTGNTASYVFGGTSVENAPVFDSGVAGRVSVGARPGEKGLLSLKGYGTFTVAGNITLAQYNGEGVLSVEGGNLSINVNGLSFNPSNAGRALYQAILTQSGISTIAVNNTVKFGGNTTFELGLGSDFETHVGEVFTLFSAVNGFTGEGRFANLLEGAILSNGSYQFGASYLNNAFTLTTLAIPEPSQFALIILGTAVLIPLRHRRSLCGKRS